MKQVSMLEKQMFKFKYLNFDSYSKGVNCPLENAQLSHILVKKFYSSVFFCVYKAHDGIQIQFSSSNFKDFIS